MDDVAYMEPVCIICLQLIWTDVTYITRNFRVISGNSGSFRNFWVISGNSGSFRNFRIYVKISVTFTGNSGFPESLFFYVKFLPSGIPDFWNSA